MSHILVVEDEPIIRSALRRLLERHHYQVSEAGAVHEAVESYDLDDFDLIISDLRLPGEPGTELIRLAASTPDRKSTRLNSSHVRISYAVFCLKKKKQNQQ